MTIKIITYGWVILVIISIIGIPVLLVCHKIKNEFPASYSQRTYSYNKILRFSGAMVVFFSIASALIYYESKNLEVSLGLLAFFMACTFAGTIRSLNTQSHLKNRGALKEEEAKFKSNNNTA